MPTEPLKTVIDRDLQRARAKKFLDVASPLFQELVNYGSNALIRCATSSKRGENEDLAALTLYRHILEMTDAFEVLISNACGWPSIPILRSSFEAFLAFEYILEDKSTYVQRSLSWLAGYHHRKLVAFETMLETSDRGKEFRAAVRKDKWVKDVPVAPQDKVTAAIDQLNKLLSSPQFAAIETEYQSHKRRPEWYQLFGGPASLQELAYHLNHHTHYDFLYRQWSSVAHATDFSQFFATDAAGERGVRGLRDVAPLQELSRFAAGYMVESTRLLLLEFRSGEDFAKYYEAEVRDRYLQIMSRKDFLS